MAHRASQERESHPWPALPVDAGFSLRHRPVTASALGCLRGWAGFWHGASPVIGIDAMSLVGGIGFRGVVSASVNGMAPANNPTSSPRLAPIPSRPSQKSPPKIWNGLDSQSKNFWNGLDSQSKERLFSNPDLLPLVGESAI